LTSLRFCSLEAEVDFVTSYPFRHVKYIVKFLIIHTRTVQFVHLKTIHCDFIRPSVS